MVKRSFILSLLIPVLLFIGCDKKSDRPDFNQLGREYVKLGLIIGQYDPDFVDAYYGPDSLKPANDVNTAEFPREELLNRTASLKDKIEKIPQENLNDTLKMRAQWMLRQLKAFERRIRIFAGDKATFDEEAADLFATEPPIYPEEHYRSLVNSLDSILPGRGSVVERYQALFEKFNIPPSKVDTVFKAALAEARRITQERFDLPGSESFTIEYVRDKAWNGYNWYQGNYTSLIQINVDHPINIARAIDLACHEGYPGHHVYNVLLEKNLYRDKGWVEISMYPLFSPQSLIAEGSANYGIEMAFPEKKFKQFTKEVLLPLAGLDTSNFEQYYKASILRKKLNFARNEIARGIINGTMTPDEITRWQVEYQFVPKERVASSLKFIEKYRSYVICYNHGEALVEQYVKANTTAGHSDQRWKTFEWLLSNPVSPPDLGEAPVAGSR